MLWNVDVFNEIDRLRREMNGVFSSYSREAGTTTFPLINAYEDNATIVVTAELSGLAKDQVSIVYTDGILTLSGKLETPDKLKKMSVVRKERSVGEFNKTIRIPSKVDQNAITASFSNGILTITLPKSEEAKPKTISIEPK